MLPDSLNTFGKNFLPKQIKTGWEYEKHTTIQV
jgi:hypothetical protein